MNETKTVEIRRKRYSPDKAVLLLQKHFRRRAKRLSQDNLSLVDDLVQEMSLGVLRCHRRRNRTLRFFFGRGLSRAVNFLRAEKRHQFRVERYSRLSHPVVAKSEKLDWVEQIVDLESKLSSRASDRLVALRGDVRTSA